MVSAHFDFELRGISEFKSKLYFFIVWSISVLYDQLTLRLQNWATFTYYPSDTSPWAVGLPETQITRVFPIHKAFVSDAFQTRPHLLTK